MVSSDESTPPKVAVVGGGWYGCQIALTLKARGFDVVLFERNARLFDGASGKNQFRLHAGFHYPRSSTTRSQISAGLREFREKLPDMCFPLDNCLYAISASDSLLDFGTYKEIFRATGVPSKEVHPEAFGITNVEGCINTSEELALFVNKPRDYYQQKLGSCVRFNSSVTQLENVSGGNGSFVLLDGERYDWCINCTYNQWYPISQTSCYYEVCLTLVYRQKKRGCNVFGITIMDGNFCSLYPYVLDAEDFQSGPRRYTLTHVKYTPLVATERFDEAQSYANSMSDVLVREKIPLFEEGFLKFYPSFTDEFVYESWFVSIKTKPLDTGASNQTASRECIAERDGGHIRVLSGKINTLFEAERLILSELLADWARRKLSERKQNRLDTPFCLP